MKTNTQMLQEVDAKIQQANKAKSELMVSMSKLMDQYDKWNTQIENLHELKGTLKAAIRFND